VIARFAAVCALACALVGWSSHAADAQKVLRVAFPTAESGFDPQNASDIYSSDVIRGIFDTLYAVDYLSRPYRIVPQAAEALPEISDGGRTLTIRVRKGIFFTPDPAFKGKPRELTAQDFVYSLKRMLDPKVRSFYLWMLDGRIVGADAIKAAAGAPGGKFDYDAAMEGLAAIDRYTLRIRLKEPYYNLVNYMTHTATAAVAREVVETYGDDLAAHPVGTGPYMLGQWRRANKIVLVANPGYREEHFPATSAAKGDEPLAESMKGKRLPSIGRIEISIIEEGQSQLLSFNNGELDFLIVPFELANHVVEGDRLKPEYVRRKLHWVRSPEPAIYYTYFNMEDSVLGGYTREKIALRRAIAMGYNLPEEIRVLRHGQAVPVTQPIPGGIPGHDPSYRGGPHFDPAAARALLDKFGYRDRDGDGYRELPDGRPLVIEKASTPTTRDRELDELWKKSMDAIGIRLNFMHQKWPDLLKLGRAAKLQMWSVGWMTVVPDGDIFYQLLYGKNIGQANYSRFNLPEFDRIYEQTKALPDSPQRTALYRKLAELADAYTPWHPGVTRIENVLVSPWVQGYKKHDYLRFPWKYLDIDARASP